MIFLRFGLKTQNFVLTNITIWNIRNCRPCTMFAYKSQNIVHAKSALSSKCKQMYQQIIVTLRYFLLSALRLEALDTPTRSWYTVWLIAQVRSFNSCLRNGQCRLAEFSVLCPLGQETYKKELYGRRKVSTLCHFRLSVWYSK